MKTKWLQKDHGRKLIIFFTGWGMDEQPISHMKAEGFDLLMFYDYRDNSVQLDLDELCSAYDSTALVAWSLGVAAAAHVCGDVASRLETALAVNGTLYPAHSELGIPEPVFDGTIEGLSEESLVRFFRRMCGSSAAHSRFMEKRPLRNLADIDEELRTLRDLTPCENSVFTQALVGTGDRIVPPGNQSNCWRRMGVSFTEVRMPHFPFFEYQSWNSLLGAADG